MDVKAYGTENKNEDLKKMSIERRELLDNDVHIDIVYCGVCHSDIHAAKNDWNNTKYPLVPGHEIIGKVRKVGNGVKKYKEGDLVGVGCIVDSCQQCSACKDDLEQFCEKGMVGTYNGKDKSIQENKLLVGILPILSFAKTLFSKFPKILT